MKEISTTIPDTQKVQLELSTAILNKIIASGLVNAAQLKCLNHESKKILWSSLLDCSQLRC